MFVKQYRNLVLLIIIICFYCCSCSTLSQKGSLGGYSQGEMEISGQSRFEDLPVPEGFILYREESFIFENDKTRMGTLSYIGKSNFESLIDFYRKNMALNGWNLMNSVEFDVVVLNFEKDEESCVVTLKKRKMSKAVVTFTLAPASKAGIVVEEEQAD